LPEACPGGIGLTTALEILNGGWVVVGSLPTSHQGTVFTGSGCLIVLNSNGHVVETFTGHGLNGPWDMAMVQAGPFAELFVANVLNGTVAAGGHVTHHGTVVRLMVASSGGNPPSIVGSAVVGSGFAERTDPAALVIGPTGLGVGRNGMLFVADTLANRIAEIPDAPFRSTSAGRGLTVTKNGALNGPLGLAIAPDGQILTVNSGDGMIVDTTESGIQVATRQLDSSGSPPGAGALFGLAVAPGGSGVYYVDDATNTLNLLS
jgi:DNA-binding beta-propeller fold protein YncE